MTHPPSPPRHDDRADDDAAPPRAQLGALASLGNVTRDIARLNSGLWERLWFTLERFMLRGPASRLLVIVAAVGLLSLAGGLLVRRADPTFTSNGDAIWWAFLRLTDPGYLGDDTGFWRALISTFLTIAGYVFFLGALVAILTQWLNQKIAELELGLRPISMEGHVVVLGWGARSVRVIEGLVRAGTRGEIWLRQTGRRRLRIATLTDRVGPGHAQDLRDRLGDEYDDRELILRSGSPLRLDHLRRVDVGAAAAVVVPAASREDPDNEVSSDARIIKTALTLASYVDPDQLPTLVVEMGDERKIAAARRIYPGTLAAVPSDRLIASLLARSMAAPGIARVVNLLLAPGHGASLYVRRFDAFGGMRFGEAADRFPSAVLVGRVTGPDHGEVELAPSPDIRLLDDDLLVLIAADFEAAEPAEPAALPSVGEVGALRVPPPRRHIFILGWNRLAPELLEELAHEPEPPTEVTVISMIKIKQRERDLADHGLVPDGFTLRHEEGSFTRLSTLERHRVNEADGIIVLASDWHATGEQADAHAITALVLLVQIFDDDGIDRHPSVSIELTDDDNAAMVSGRDLDAITGSTMISYTLSHAVLNPAFAGVLREIFQPARGLSVVNPTGLIASGRQPFGAIQAHARAHGLIAIGLIYEDGREPQLAVPRDRVVDIDDEARLVVLGALPR